MQTWQHTLASIVHNNIDIPIQNEKQNEFDFMKFFVNNICIRYIFYFNNTYITMNQLIGFVFTPE